MVEDVLLQGRDGRETESADQEDRRDGHGFVGGQEGEQTEHHGQTGQGGVEHRHEIAVGEMSPDEVADHHAGSEHGHQPGDGGLGETADIGQDRCDVGDRGEHAPEAEDRHGHGQHDLDVLERRDLVTQPDALGSGDVGDEFRDAHETDDAERGDDQERRPPARGVADEGTQWDADDIGHRQSGEHQGDGSGLLLRCHQLRGDHRADAEERSMSEGGDHAADQHDGEGGREGRDGIAQDEQAHEQHQHVLTGDPGAERRHDRGADHDAEGVAGDEISGGGDRHSEIRSDLGEQPHDHELGGADSEGTDGQGQQGEWHENDPSIEKRRRRALLA